MYADTISESMDSAIKETNRRRKLQEQYNKEHGIVPKTIVKEIREVISNVDESVDDKTGTPTVKGTTIEAEVIKNGRAKKIKVFKYRPKKKYHKTQGNRQPYTLVEIKKING